MMEEARSPRKKTTITVAAKISQPSHGLRRIVSFREDIISSFKF
jgi:hypothetical protein